MKKVTMESDPSLAEDGYTGAANIVNIKTNIGKEFSLRVDHAKGSPKNPLSLDELLEKYRYCAGAILNPASIDRSIHCLLELEKLERIESMIALFNDF
jgi:2-methylcitrate dehydratase